MDGEYKKKLFLLTSIHNYLNYLINCSYITNRLNSGT